jgi:hypothetical protein
MYCSPGLIFHNHSGPFVTDRDWEPGKPDQCERFFLSPVNPRRVNMTQACDVLFDGYLSADIARGDSVRRRYRTGEPVA